MPDSILDLLPGSGSLPSDPESRAGANPPMRALQRGKAQLFSDEEAAQINREDLRPENLSEFRRAIDTERDPKKRSLLQGDYDALLEKAKQIPQHKPADEGLKVLQTFGRAGTSAIAPPQARADTRAPGEQPARMVLTRAGQPVLESPYDVDYGRQEEPMGSATWKDVLTSLPAQVVASGRATIGALERMWHEDAAASHAEAAAPGTNPLGYRIRPEAAALQQTRAEQESAAAQHGAERAAQGARELQLVTPPDMSTGQQAISALAQSSPPTLAGIAVGILTKNPALAMAIAGGGGAGMQGAQTYQEAREKGVPVRQAQAHGAIDAFLEAGGEALPLHFVLRPGTALFRRMWTSIAAEAGQEAATQAMQDLHAYLSFDPNITLGDAWQNVKVAALAGAAGGVVFGGLGHAAQMGGAPPLSAPQQPPAEETPGPAPTHVLPNGTPVAPHEEGGKRVAGLWKDQQGNLHEAPAAKPLQLEPNAEFVVNGVPYDVEVLGKGERPGSARLSDGQEVSIASLFNMDDEAKIRLGLLPPQDVEQAAEDKGVPTGLPTPEEVAAAAATPDDGDAVEAAQAAAAAKPTEPPKPPPSMEPTRSLQRQNRMRENVASIEQMNRIANRPDYDRLSFSKAPETGAPMASFAGDTGVPAAQLGRTSTVTIADQKIPVQYAVVEAKDLLASNFVTGKRNEDYYADPEPGQLRALNNGRAAGIKEAYGRDTAEAYKAAMLADQDHGIDPKVIEGMKRPVLIRLYPDEWNTKISNIGEASQGETLQLNPLEHALGDAAKLTNLDDFKPDESGDVLAPANMAFVNRFLQDVVPESERGRYFDQNKRPNKAAVDRIEAAVFQKAYGSKDLTSMFAEQTDPEIRSVLSALSIASPEMAKLDGAPPEVDLRPYVAESAKLMLMAKRQGVKLSQLLDQADIEGRNPLIEQLARFMAENVRSPKKMADGMIEGAKFAQFAAVNSKTGDMFGGGEINMSHILERIKTYMETTYATKTQGPSLFAPETAQGAQAPENQPGARQPAGRYEAPGRHQEGRVTEPAEHAARAGGQSEEAVRQANQNLKGESHATETGKQQRGEVGEHRGVPQGRNVREDRGEVRQGQGEQAGGGRGAGEREAPPYEGRRTGAEGGIESGGERRVGAAGARRGSVRVEETERPRAGGRSGAESVAQEREGRSHAQLPTPDLKAAARATETEPTPGQIEAGNYAKGKYLWNGLTISLENPKGSIRRAADGSWESKMAHHYGYIRGTLDRTGEQIDTFIGPHPASDQVYVIEQEHQGSGIFDEPKVMLGFDTAEEAKRGYLDNYPRGWKAGPIVPMNVDQFKTWLETGNTTARPSEMPIEQLIPGLTPELRKRAEQIRDQYARGQISDKAYAKFVEKLRSRWSPPVAQTEAQELTGAHTVEGVRDEINATEFGRKVSHMVEAVQRVNDLPEYIYDDIKHRGEFAEKNVNGVWDPISHKVYVVASNTDPGTVNQIMLHELVGHHGIEAMLGEKMSDFLREVYASNSPAIQQQARSGYLAPYQLDFTKAAHREIAAAEYIAYTAERGENPDLWQRFVAKVREILRSMGFVKDWSDNDIRNLLRRSRNSLMHGGDVSMNGETLYEFGQEEQTPLDDYQVRAARRKGERQGEAAPQRDLFTEAALRREEEKYPLIVEPKQTGTMRIGFDRLDTPEKAAHAFAAIRKSPFEKFQMIVTDANDKPIAAWHMFSGTVAQTSVYPREVVTAAYMTPGAKKVWFAHNHPSGVAEPSHADEILTRSLIATIGDTEIRVSGHIIIAGNQARAFDVPMAVDRSDIEALLKSKDLSRPERAELERQLAAPAIREDRGKFAIPPASRKFAIPVLERTITRQSFGPREALSSPRAMRDYFRKSDPKETGLLLLDTQHRALGFWPMSLDEMEKIGTEAGRLYRMIGRLNPGAAVVYSPSRTEDPLRVERVVRQVKIKLSLIDVSLLDAFAPTTSALTLTSFAEKGLLEPPGPSYSMRQQKISERTGEPVYRIHVTLYGEPKGKTVQSYVSKSDVESRKEYWRKNMPESAIVRATPMWETGAKLSMRQTTFAKDDEGRPLLSGELVDVVNPRIVPDGGPEGVLVYNHDILVGKTRVGMVMLGWRGDVAADLPFIMIFPKFKGLGLGEDTVRAILEHNQGQPLKALEILPQARNFWRKMGVQFEKGTDNGILTYQRYLDQRPSGKTPAAGRTAAAESAVEEIDAGSAAAPGAEVPRQRYSIRDPKGLSQVYGIRNGRLQGVAVKSYRGGIWEVYVGKEGNPTLFAQGDFDRIQASDIGEVQRIFNQKGLEFRAIKPTNIPLPDKSIFDKNWMAPQADTFFKRATIYLQNRLLLPELQERAIERTLGPIPEEAKAHREARLAHPRAAGKMADFDHEFTEPILKEMRNARLTLREVGDYLYARHAEERNAAIEQINPENVSGSGMPTEEAEATLRTLQQDTNRWQALERIGSLVDGVNQTREQVMVDKGLAKRQAIELLRAKYKHYVPLKEMAEDEFIQSPIGGGYQVGRVINTAFGRFTRANSDLILPAVIAQAKGTIAAGENAEVLRALLRQSEFAPNPDVWRLQKAVWKPYLDKDTGEVRYAPRPVMIDANYGSRAISIPVDGERHILVVTDQRFADAFKRSGLPLPDFMQTLGTVTRFYALMATGANPEFVVTNLMRDFQQAMIRLTGEKSPELAAKVAKDLVPALWGAFSGLRAKGQYIPGESAKPGAEEWHSWYRRFIEAGGQVAYRGISDVETQHKDFLKSLADAGIYPESLGGIQKGILKAHHAAKATGAKFLTQLVLDANGAVENALRLSTFKNLVDAGYTEKDAALAARNVTVDFNLKGEASTRIGALWMFFNANMQGNAILVRSIINSKGVRWLAAALFLMGMGMDAWNRRHANKNADGRTSYDNVSSDMKEKNFVLMAPDGDNAITVPLSFGFNIFYMAGVHAMAAIDGSEKPLQAGMSTMIGIMNAFNPAGQTPTSALGLLQLISPTFSDPAIQAATNRDWRDKTIVPERPKFAPPQAKAETYYSSTPPMYVDAARWLNEFTGGNEIRSGLIDVSPNMLRHWVNSLFGSAGATYARLADIVHGKATGDELETRDIPIARRFYYEPKDFELSHRFYDYLNAAEVAHFEVQRAYQGNQGEKARLLQEEFRGERTMYGEGVQAERAVAQIRSQISMLRKDDRIPDDVKKKRIEQAEEQSRRVMMQFNARFEAVAQ